jgi:hypothetical protein
LYFFFNQLLEIFYGVFSSSRSTIIFDVSLRISAVSSDGETDERKERKGGNCSEGDNEDEFKALDISIKHSVHPESLNSDFIKLECSTLELFHELMIKESVEQINFNFIKQTEISPF